MAYDRYAVELTDKDGQIYGVMDAEAREEVGELNSALNVVVETEEKISFAGYSANNVLASNTSTAPFVLHENAFEYTNYRVTKMKLKGVTAGRVSVGVIKKEDVIVGASADRTKAVVKAIVTITTGEQTVDIPTPFNVAEDEFLFIGMPGDTARWTYGSHGELLFCYVDSNWIVSGNSIGVNFYVERYKYSAEIQNTINSVVTINDLLEIGAEQNATVYKSLADNASSSADLQLSPFIINKIDYSNAPYNVIAIKMKIKSVGTLTVGRILKADVVIGDTFDPTALVDPQTIQITQTGVQTIPIAPIEITNMYYLFVGTSTDTAVFYYSGSTGDLDTNGFCYVSGGKYIAGGSYIGVDVIATMPGAPTNIREVANSVYADKKLSILGDSISTFSGYIPEGNATYYPSGTVQAVSDTWWYKLYTALGMKLDTNNSWSGSRVTTTGGDASAGCMTRCQNLGTPDVIIVWMGINDFNNEVQIGTYDGTTALPSATTTFREAYAIMLNKILTEYQTAEVWVCTLPQCERNAETVFPEINGNGVALAEFNKAILELANAFGVKVLDHNKSGLTYQNMPTFNPDKLHPNKYGHSLIANNDIRQMDGVVSKRYPIS